MDHHHFSYITKLTKQILLQDFILFCFNVTFKKNKFQNKNLYAHILNLIYALNCTKI
jgi:hypothetical protein